MNYNSKNKENRPIKDDLLYELSFLKDMREVMNTRAGRRVILQIIDMGDPLSPNVFTGNSHTYYLLGIQHVVNTILMTIAKAGIKLDITDISKKLSKLSNREDQINELLNKILKEENNNVTSRK